MILLDTRGEAIDCDRGTEKWTTDFGDFGMGNCGEEWQWKARFATTD